MKKLISNFILITIISVVSLIAGADEKKAYNENDPNLRYTVDGEYVKHTADKSVPAVANMYKQAPQEKQPCTDCNANSAEIRDNTAALPGTASGATGTQQKADK